MIKNYDRTVVSNVLNVLKDTSVRKNKDIFAAVRSTNEYQAFLSNTELGRQINSTIAELSQDFEKKRQKLQFLIEQTEEYLKMSINSGEKIQDGEIYE